MTWGASDITAVVTCHDSGPLLRRALDSVAGQGEINIVLVDDGSTNCSCFDIAHSYAHLIHLTKDNGGHPSALNRGIDHVETDLIAFLDDDDEWLPGKVARHLNLLNTSSAEAVVGGVWNVWEGDDGERKRTYLPSARLLGSSTFTTHGLRRIGPFTEQTRHHSIIDWWSRAYVLDLEPVCDEEPALLRRIHGANSGIVHRIEARQDLLHHLRQHIARRHPS